MKDCQTALPPSNHESGGIYIFLNNDPTEPPAEIEFEKIVKCFEKFCVVKSQKSKRQKSKRRIKMKILIMIKKDWRVL